MSNVDSHLQRTVGLTPENGLSPNEFMFPQRIPLHDSDNNNSNENYMKVKYEGSVDSMAVLEQMEAAEQKER